MKHIQIERLGKRPFVGARVFRLEFLVKKQTHLRESDVLAHLATLSRLREPIHACSCIPALPR
jgi:hypothetical protein